MPRQRARFAVMTVVLLQWRRGNESNKTARAGAQMGAFLSRIGHPVCAQADSGNIEFVNSRSERGA